MTVDSQAYVKPPQESGEGFSMFSQDVFQYPTDPRHPLLSIPSSLYFGLVRPNSFEDILFPDLVMDPEIPIRTSQQASLVVVPVVFSLLATAAVALRILARRVSNRSLEASDYVMITALIVTMAFSAVIAAEPFTGAGLHMSEVEAVYGSAPLVTYLKVRPDLLRVPRSWTNINHLGR